MASDGDSSFAFERMGEYKALLDYVDHQSERRQNLNNVFVSLNTVFLTSIGVLLFASQLRTWWITIAIGAISIAVLPLNLTWRKLLNVYRRSSDNTFAYLREIEAEFRSRRGSADIMAPIGRFSRFYSEPEKGSQLNPSLELRLTMYFLLLYPLVTLVIALLTYFIAIGIITPLSIR